MRRRPVAIAAYVAALAAWLFTVQFFDNRTPDGTSFVFVGLLILVGWAAISIAMERNDPSQGSVTRRQPIASTVFIASFAAWVFTLRYFDNGTPDGRLLMFVGLLILIGWAVMARWRLAAGALAGILVYAFRPTMTDQGADIRTLLQIVILGAAVGLMWDAIASARATLRGAAAGAGRSVRLQRVLWWLTAIGILVGGYAAALWLVSIALR